MTPPAWLHDAAFVQQLQQDLRQHAAFGDKQAGGPGDAATAAWVAQRLAGIGYSVERQPVAVPTFAPLDCCLGVGDASAALWPQPPVLPTDRGGITAPLAVVRHLQEAADARGRIALLVLPHGRHASMHSPRVLPLVQAAVAAGALAVVIVPTGPTADVVGLNCDPAEPVAAVPTAILAPAAAEPFLLAARTPEQARFRLAGNPGTGDSCNLVATLQRGPRWIAISTPRTGWFGCASERGTGTAAFLALARWAAEQAPGHSVFLLNSGAHEYLFAGARRAMSSAPGPAETDCWVHLGASLATRDRLEIRGHEQLLPSADPNRIVMGTAPMLPALAGAFAGISGLERPVPVATGMSELGEIAAHGYLRCFAVLGIPKVFHSRQDTVDVVDGALLAPVVRAHARALADALSCGGAA